MIRFRRTRGQDLDRVSEIYDKHHAGHFGLKPENIITKGVVEKDGRVVAFGMVQALSEAIMVLDLDESTRTKIESLSLLMENAIFDSASQGFDAVHVFVQDKSFAEILKRHHKFQVCAGEALVREI